LAGEGPRYHRASECAALIANLLGGDYPGGRARLHSRLTFLILEALYAVDSDLGRGAYRPSDN
jgi:hypothetical protein